MKKNRPFPQSQTGASDGSTKVVLRAFVFRHDVDENVMDSARLKLRNTTCTLPRGFWIADMVCDMPLTESSLRWRQQEPR